MKRKIALFMVLAMIVGLIPMNVFASSDNSVGRAPSINSDTVWTTETTNVPTLRVEEDNAGDFEDETFQVVLTNAEWEYDTKADFEADMKAYIEASDNVADDVTVTATVTVLSDTKMEVNVVVDNDGSETAMFKVAMATNFDEDGEAKVAVKALDSMLSSSTHTFAVVTDGSTTTTVEDTTDFSDIATIEDITIEENSIQSMQDDGNFIMLKLVDGDFTWVADNNDEPVDEDDVVIAPTFSGGFDSGADVTATVDDNILTLEIDNLYGGVTPEKRGTITISGLQVDPSTDANYGDVKVKVYDEDDNMTEETITIGTYMDYATTAEADDAEADLPVLYSGNYDVANLDDENELSMLTIEELVADAWDTDRTTTIEFPDWVKIIDIATEDDTDNLNNIVFNDYIGESEVEITADKASTTSTSALALTFQVSVEAGKTGDIVAKISGRGLDKEHSVKLGVAKAPVTVTAEVKDVKIGVQEQAVGVITLVEAGAEVLASGDDITLTIGDDDDFEISEDPTVKVTKGDATIDDVEVDGNIITITIDDESTEASTIEVSGIKVDVDRTVAEGNYKVAVGGSALVMNAGEDEDFFFEDSDSIVEPAFVRVITPAPADTTVTQKVVFTIDNKEYMVGDTKVTSDVAPYIDGNSRTMLPVRAMANALNVTDSSILWNDAEKSVTIFKGDRVIKIVVGASSFTLNGTPVPMDTMAVIKESRTFLPAAALVQAMGKGISWDPATRTVTIQ